MIVVEVVRGETAGRIFELDQPTVTLGRSSTNALALPDYHLSGEHGQIFREEDQYVYRDLKSTNGTVLERGDRKQAVDATCRYEIVLRDGDRLVLGDPERAVVLSLRLPASTRPAEVDPVAARPLDALGEVAGKLEADPQGLRTLYRAAARLGGRLEVPDALDAVVETVFEALPRVTHAAIFLASEADPERFVVATSRARAGGGTAPTVHASRAVLRRVLESRSALLVADAAGEMSASESIHAGQMRSILAVPLWREGEIFGAIQADNRTATGMLTEREMDLLLAIGAQAALALENARLVARLRVAEERLRGENRYLRGREERRRHVELIGESAPMKQVLAQIAKVAATRVTVCITGETGTGKELVASSIHAQGPRAGKLFVAQNCAAMPETLLESELFGHKRGAFTGADHDKKGLFEVADGGTLFLDEIGETSLGLQAKLLRALQEGTIRPVGGEKERPVDVRIVCATNRDLAAEVAAGRFRQDLFYRLMVFPIRLPALRERRDDVALLARHFLARYTQEYRKPIAGISQAALDALAGHAWPGNIRELENEVQRTVIQVENDAWIEVNDLSPPIRKVESTLGRIAPKKGTLKDMVEEVERFLLTEALRDHKGNKTQTAVTLGMTREGLHKKLAKFGLT